MLFPMCLSSGTRQRSSRFIFSVFVSLSFSFSPICLERIVSRDFKTKSSNYLADSECELETNIESDEASEDELESESDFFLFNTFFAFGLPTKEKAFEEDDDDNESEDCLFRF